jgi:hypothetical protein
MLAVSKNDGSRYRVLAEGEEPMRVDARLGQDLAEWPVQTGMVSLVPDLMDVATLSCVLYLVRTSRGDPDWQPSPVVHDSDVLEWVIDRPSAVRQTLYPSANDAILATWACL